MRCLQSKQGDNALTVFRTYGSDFMLATSWHGPQDSINASTPSHACPCGDNKRVEPGFVQQAAYQLRRDTSGT